MVSLLYVSLKLPIFQKAATRMHSLSIYQPLYEQPGMFSKCIITCLCRYQDIDKEIIRTVSSIIYHLYGQPGGFSKCSSYHSISHIHQPLIWFLSCMYFLMPLDTKIRTRSNYDAFFQNLSPI